MVDRVHDHNITVCAGCLIGDLRIAVRRLSEHNSTTGVSRETLFVAKLLDEILEAYEDATHLTAALWPEA